MKYFNSILLTALLLTLIISPVKSQIPVDGSESLLFKLRLNNGVKGKEDITYENIKGDPYLFKNFQKGKLILNAGNKIDVNVRYDIYANEIHLKEKSEIFAIIHPEKVKMIETDSLKFIYSEFIKSNDENASKGSSYFIIKTNGKCKLLIKKNIRIQDSEPAKLYQEAKPAMFVHTNDTYYLKLEDKSAVKIKSKKEVLSVLGNQTEAISKFIDTNNLKINDIKDLDRIVSYYNGL